MLLNLDHGLVIFGEGGGRCARYIRGSPFSGFIGGQIFSTVISRGVTFRILQFYFVTSNFEPLSKSVIKGSL